MSGPVAKAHKKSDAAHVIGMLGAEIEYDVDRESLAQQRKGVWWRALLAARVKKHCAARNEWIAKCLEMGHGDLIIKIVIFFQESKEGVNLMNQNEIILISKD